MLYLRPHYPRPRAGAVVFLVHCTSCFSGINLLVDFKVKSLIRLVWAVLSTSLTATLPSYQRVSCPFPSTAALPRQLPPAVGLGAGAGRLTGCGEVCLVVPHCLTKSRQPIEAPPSALATRSTVPTQSDGCSCTEEDDRNPRAASSENQVYRPGKNGSQWPIVSHHPAPASLLAPTAGLIRQQDHSTLRYERPSQTRTREANASATECIMGYIRNARWAAPQWSRCYSSGCCTSVCLFRFTV